MSLALKLSSLFFRTISKPIASAIKNQAQQHPAFRKLCIRFAQNVHRADVNIRRRLLGERALNVRPLNDTKAIQTGSNFLADSFVFGVAGGVILIEYNRQRLKEQARRASIADDIKVLQEQITWLENKLIERKVFKAGELDFVVPDNLLPSLLRLKRANGTITGDTEADEEQEKHKAKLKPDIQEEVKALREYNRKVE